MQSSGVNIDSSMIEEVGEDNSVRSMKIADSRFGGNSNFATLPQRLSLPRIKQTFVSPKNSVFMRNKLGKLINTSSRKVASTRW